ncbi:MAG: hypothetical protein NZ839_04445 [Endomicrobia bacterium]|nr:hypothetical protein [Endomicrobiia bacterium]
MKKFSLIIPLFLFLFGCFTIMIPPKIYEPSILKKNNADVSYCIDEKIKNIELVTDKGTKYKSNFAQTLTYSLQKTMEQIFYSPKEVGSFEESKSKYLILFEKDTSELKEISAGSLIYSNYEYTIKIRVTIYKDKKKIDEIIATGRGYKSYQEIYEKLTSFECIRLATTEALDKVIRNIGEYLMNFKFE